MLFIKLGKVFAHLLLWLGLTIYVFGNVISFLDGSAVKSPIVDTGEAVLAMLAGISLGILAEVGDRVVQLTTVRDTSKSD